MKVIEHVLQQSFTHRNADFNAKRYLNYLPTKYKTCKYKTAVEACYLQEPQREVASGSTCGSHDHSRHRTTTAPRKTTIPPKLFLKFHFVL